MQLNSVKKEICFHGRGKVGLECLDGCEWVDADGRWIHSVQADEENKVV
jgi:hypothetical protein